MAPVSQGAPGFLCSQGAVCLCSFKKKISALAFANVFVASPEVMAPWFEFFFVCLFVFHWAYLCSTGNWFEGARGAGDKVVYFRFLQWVKKVRLWLHQIGWKCCWIFEIDGSGGNISNNERKD